MCTTRGKIITTTSKNIATRGCVYMVRPQRPTIPVFIAASVVCAAGGSFIV